MHLTKEEIKTAVFSLVFLPNGEERNTFPLAELKDASDAFQALNTSADEAGSYKDGDVELSAEQKGLILKCLDRSWPPADGIHVLSLKSKLEK